MMEKHTYEGYFFPVTREVICLQNSTKDRDTSSEDNDYALFLEDRSINGWMLKEGYLHSYLQDSQRHLVYHVFNRIQEYMVRWSNTSNFFLMLLIQYILTFRLILKSYTFHGMKKFQTPILK